MRRSKPLYSLNSFLSYAHQLSGANPVSLFTLLLAFCQLLSNWGAGTRGGGPTTSTGSHRSQLVLGALIHLWRPEIADGCFISCLLIWQEIFSFHSMLLINRKKKLLCQGHCNEEAFQRPDLQPQPRPSVSSGENVWNGPSPACHNGLLAAPAGMSLVP